MEKKSAKELFREVDPNLKVVSAGHHRSKHEEAEQNWLAATGATCAGCGTETQQSKDGLCMKCWQEKQDNTIEIRDKAGVLPFFGDNILEQITHKANNKQ